MATDLARSSSDLDPRLLAGREASGSDVQPHYDLQLSVLETLATARNYNEWVASLVLPHLGDDPIEIGSGLGDQASVWLENGVGRITLSDLEQRSVEALAERFAEDDRVSIRNLDLADCEPGVFSSAVAINVLEHVEDDISALRATRALVRVGGKVIVFVPAFPLAMSRFDREIGHHRRYTTRSLGERLGAAGLEPLVVRYLNAPGLIAWIVMMRLLRRRPSAGPVVRAWDRRVIPIARRLERRRAAPFGQSVLAVAVRPPDG
jgi:SAM-dependent methyltransferase